MAKNAFVLLVVLIILLSGCFGTVSDEPVDIDSDGIPDSIDTDDDNDGWNDTTELNCGSDPILHEDQPSDFDADGVCDQVDKDDDNDNISDDDDAFPMNPMEQADNDADGIGDVADIDDDNDGWNDTEEVLCGNDPFNSSSIPPDKDADGICDSLDAHLQELLDRYRNSSRPFANHTDDPEWYGMNITTWQMENGGWRKNNMDGYMSPWIGDPIPATSPSFANLSTLADRATAMEIRFLSSLYSISINETNRTTFKDAVGSGIDFILESQHESGGWPQVFPPHDNCTGCEYHQLMTYNDHVITSAMLLLLDVSMKRAPFDSEIIDDVNLTQIDSALDKGMEYILNSQIVNNGTPTIWGQQHDPYTFESKPGRSYELAGKATAESVGIVALLLVWENRTPEIINATWGAVGWFEDNLIEDEAYLNGKIVDQSGSAMWYRFYNVSEDQHFLAGRDGIKVYDIGELNESLASGYSWAGSWAIFLLEETSKIPESERN